MCSYPHQDPVSHKPGKGDKIYTYTEAPAAGPKLVVINGISFFLSKHLLGGAPWCHGSYWILLCDDQAVSVQWCKSACCFLLYLSGGTSCQQCLFQPWDVRFYTISFSILPGATWSEWEEEDESLETEISFLALPRPCSSLAETFSVLEMEIPSSELLLNSWDGARHRSSISSARIHYTLCPALKDPASCWESMTVCPGEGQEFVPTHSSSTVTSCSPNHKALKSWDPCRNPQTQEYKLLAFLLLRQQGAFS